MDDSTGLIRMVEATKARRVETFLPISAKGRVLFKRSFGISQILEYLYNWKLRSYPRGFDQHILAPKYLEFIGVF